MEKQKNIFKNPYFQFILLGIALAILPTLTNMGIIKSSYVTVVGTTIIYAIAALGLNVLLGFSGLVSLGTAGFMGLAAYLSAYFTGQMNLPFELSFLLSVVITTGLGILVGVFSLKFEGIYLGIATLAVAEILREIFYQFDKFTGGASGASASYPKLFGFLQLDRTGMYYLIVFVMVIVFIIIYNLMKGHLGRALNVMRGSPPAAQAMGVNIFKYRLIAFGLATALAAVAGVLYVHYIRLSYPTTWQLNLSLDFLAIIVIGGFRSIYGTLIGSFVVFGVSEIFFKPFPVLANISPVIKGVMMIIFVIYYPQGLVGIKTSIQNRRAKRKEKEAAND